MNIETTNILGDYTLIKQIGQGGLGTVFLAEHRYLQQQFMIKILPLELAEERAFIKRFEEGVAQLASLDHPHIVKIHNVSHDRGLYFLVSDCVVDSNCETLNLAQYLALHSVPLNEKDVERLLMQIASALDYAHSRGVAHRGLKFNNILLAHEEGELIARLCDFGLSAIVGESLILARTFRVVADTLGAAPALYPQVGEEERFLSGEVNHSTLSVLQQSFRQNFLFLAPEQFSTAAGSKSADVYAFGVLAYRLLTGSYPEGAFPLPSELVQIENSRWDALVMRMLHPTPEERPESLVPFLTGSEAHSPYLSNRNRAAAGEPKPTLKDSKLERPTLDPDPAAALEVDGAVKSYTPKPSHKDDVEPIPSDMAVIPAGDYTHGSQVGNRDEMPQHAIYLDSFAIDVHPVINEQFVRFLEAMGGEKDHEHRDLIWLKDSRIKRRAGKLVIESGYAKHPVTGVTWYGAKAYAKWVGKRLPTEAEWEIASAGEGGDAYPTGSSIEKSKANFFSSDTTPIKSYEPNAHGLYDMGGNVYEWCSDWYGYNYYEESQQEPDNPQGPQQGVYRVLRGGCWKSLKEDLRCSRRHRNKPGAFNSTYGFRCATDTE